MHKFNSTILREYDVRGVVGETLTEADARFLGKSFGSLIKRNGGHKRGLGFDGGLS